MNAELLRILSNLCSFGTVVETKSAEGLALARVKIDDRVTDFFPVASQSNSFKKHYIPVRVGEQVTVFCPYGEGNIGFIIRSIFNKNCKEPIDSSDTKEVIIYEDGTSISYDTSTSTLELIDPKKMNLKIGELLDIEVGETINITGAQTVNIKAPNINLEGNTTTIKSTSINLLGNTVIQGSVSAMGSAGASGSFDIQGNLSISKGITVGGDANISGSIIDSKGNLTNHTNNGYGRD